MREIVYSFYISPMRKIKHTNITEQHGLTALPIDWGNTYLFKNKDKAKRTATRLNKHYQNQLQTLNFIYADLYRTYRHYWLFLKQFDNEQLKQRFEYISAEFDHALEYQDQLYNTPADINRVLVDLAGCTDTLLMYATKRKDIPLQHYLKYIKQQLEDGYNRKPAINARENKHKRAALRKAAG